MKIGIGLGVSYFTPPLKCKEKDTFNKSLVDAWFMSGLHNEDRPLSIAGINSKAIYPVDFNTLYGNKNNITPTTIEIDKDLPILNDGVIDEGGTYTMPSFTIKVDGITDNYSYIGFQYEDTTGQHILLEITNNGTYVVPSHTFEYNENMPVWVVSIEHVLSDDGVTITQIPNISTNDFVLNNFAYSEISGFNEQGSLVFDGMDDYLVINPTNFNIGTIIMSVVDLEDPTRDYLYFFDSDNPRTYFSKAEGYYRIGNNGISYKYEDNIAVLDYNIRFSINRFTIGSAVSAMFHRKIALNFIAIYEDVLTIEQSDKEIINLKKEWKNRMTK